MFLFHGHHSDIPCKFSQVAEQTQQQGRRSINALRLCLTSAKNGGQCQSCHLSINVNNLCLVEKSSKQSTSINIQQNSSDFALSCPMPHVVDPCPLGQQLSQPGPAIHIRGGWLSVTATCPIQGKALVKNLNFINFNEKNTPRSPRFCLRKSRWL